MMVQRWVRTSSGSPSNGAYGSRTTTSCGAGRSTTWRLLVLRLVVLRGVRPGACPGGRVRPLGRGRRVVPGRASSTTRERLLHPARRRRRRSWPARRPGTRSTLSRDELRDAVARCRVGLQRLGVTHGDRVVAYLPNIAEAVVAFLATASLGAVWASCPPEFGPRSVLDRFGQLEPVVLLTVGGYRYGAKDVDRSAEVAEIRAGLPTLTTVVEVAYTAAAGARVAGVGRAARRARSARVRPGRLRPPAVRAVLLGHHGAAEGDRARPRRDPARAPQGAGAAPGPGSGRPLLLVHHHRLDDVELHGVGAGPGVGGGVVRRRPRRPRPHRAVAGRGVDGHDRVRRRARRS